MKVAENILSLFGVGSNNILSRTVELFMISGKNGDRDAAGLGDKKKGR